MISAGASGVGKTCLALAFLRKYDYEFLNADDVAKSLSAEKAARNKSIVFICRTSIRDTAKSVTKCRTAK
jgi:predicted kinase